MKFLYKRRNRKTISDFDIGIKDIENAKSIVFSIFGRYGDSVIGFAVSLEFIKKYPNKNYLFITSPQNYAYFYDKTKDMKNIKIIKFKKDNVAKLFYLQNLIKKYDLGFNPFSWGMESEYLISFAKQYKFFANHNCNNNDNVYNINRCYLQLNELEFKINKFRKENYQNILICPESSEDRRSLTQSQLDYVIDFFKDKNIIVAMSKNRFKTDKKEFYFSKKNSNKFLDLVKQVDLVVSVDSGPIHIAMLYDKNIIALFSSSLPEKALNSKKNIKIIRNNKLSGILCEKYECKEAKCLEFIKNIDLFDYNYKQINPLNLEIKKECVL